MDRKAISILAVPLLLLCFVHCAKAGSIWAKRDKNMKEVNADDIARQIGDILTIRIIEDSSVDNSASRNLDKTTSRSSAFDGELNIDHILPSIPGLTMSAETSNNLSSATDYKDDRLFEDLISVVVVDILPNHNLVVFGTRSRDIAGDKQSIEISGIVRPSDIDFDNTIDSEKVADFQIITKNSGPSTPYVNPGWLGRIMDFLWPF